MFDKRVVKRALRAQLPLVPPAPLFGMVLGLTIAEGERVGLVAGWATSVLIFGGASQLASIVLLNSGGSLIMAVATVTLINLRHLMYSAALQQRFRASPAWFRWGASYLLIDQVFATSIDEPVDSPIEERQAFFLVAGLFWWTLWVTSVSVGMVIGSVWGDVIPASWGLGFSAPLMFLGLMVNSIKDRPGLAAAVVSGAVAVSLQAIEPTGLGLIAGAGAGLVVATIIDGRNQRSAEHPFRPGNPSTEGAGS